MAEQASIAGHVLKELKGQKSQSEVDGLVANQEHDIARGKLKQRVPVDHHCPDEVGAQR